MRDSWEQHTGLSLWSVSTQAEHYGMRTYFFSADTQEDMAGWVRALSQCANVETESPVIALNKRCSSFEDFTQLKCSSDSLELPAPTSPTDGSAQPRPADNAARIEPTPRAREKGGAGPREEWLQNSNPISMNKPSERREKQSQSQATPPPAGVETPPTTPRIPCEPNGRRVYKDRREDPAPAAGQWDRVSTAETPPLSVRTLGSRPVTPRGHLATRPHTPVGRVDIRPHGDPSLSPGPPVTSGLGSSPPSPLPGSSSGQEVGHASSSTSNQERRQAPHRAWFSGAGSNPLPPLPPARGSLSHRSRLSLALAPPTAPTTLLSPWQTSTPDLYQEKAAQPIRVLESDVDSLLTQICGRDKILQNLCFEMTQLRADKVRDTLRHSETP
ncbi:pleckstrin homology domain-containing family A member 4-like isoform X3 [Polyodon spathula]|uniref:pleckstrin homology domain-containing family A member 4-like isoform X3 n=1 Tax=Polyodon spathula TaxID=7913 RepID=UPI001B7E9E21|nr:pleckstrin homology domain-containing family A member 4-like isoform X3 [Polyodon spathula]